MLKRLLFWISGYLPCRLIDVAGKPYLERYSLLRFENGTRVHLHRFVASDDDRFVHDHPWRWAVAVILSGGYTEERMDCLHLTEGWWVRLRKMFPLRINVIRGGDFHRVTNPKVDTWTLFIHGPKVKPWGFLSLTEVDGKSAVLYTQSQDAETMQGWAARAQPGRLTARTPLGGGLRPGTEDATAG